MNLQSTIQKKRLMLTKKAKAKGLYENFGQKEVDFLEKQFIDISSYTDEMNKRRGLISDFNNWCMNFDLSQINN